MKTIYQNAIEMTAHDATTTARRILQDLQAAQKRPTDPARLQLVRAGAALGKLAADAWLQPAHAGIAGTAGKAAGMAGAGVTA
ncbi:MAG: hypothetical protein ABJA84_00200 [Polaromonas sp.]